MIGPVRVSPDKGERDRWVIAGITVKQLCYRAIYDNKWGKQRRPGFEPGGELGYRAIARSIKTIWLAAGSEVPDGIVSRNIKRARPLCSVLWTVSPTQNSIHFQIL